jgi:hypothetical protein
VSSMGSGSNTFLDDLGELDLLLQTLGIVEIDNAVTYLVDEEAGNV